MSRQARIALPTTEKEFDTFVKLLCKTYRFKNQEHVEAIVAMRIQHLPPDQAHSTLDYFADCIKKNMAFQVATYKSKVIQHKMQVEALDAVLQANPTDQQALDALDAAAKEGSALAKAVLLKYRSDAQIIPMIQSKPQEPIGA